MSGGDKIAMRRSLFCGMTAASSLFLGVAGTPSFAGPYRFAPVKIDGGRSVTLTGINDADDVVGTYIDKTGGEHAFLQQIMRHQGSGAVTLIAPPNAVSTTPVGVNNLGEIAGNYSDNTGANWGFRYSAAEGFNLIKPAGAIYCFVGNVAHGGGAYGTCQGATGPFGYHATSQIFRVLHLTEVPNPAFLIGNGFGAIAGSFTYQQVYGAAFIRSHFAYTLFEEPVESIVPIDIDREGDVLLYQVDGYDNGVFAWVQKAGGGIQPVAPPNATQTVPVAIDNAGDIVGWYADSFFQSHGFLYSGGTYTDVTRYNGAVVIPTAMNEKGDIVGYAISVQGTHVPLIGYRRR